MKIELSNIGKHFGYRWVFKDISFDLEKGQSIAITGPNGIGKSTLLKIIAGYIEPSEGIIKYELNNTNIKPEDIYNYTSYAAPYMELINEFKLSELIHFYSSNKKVNIESVNRGLKEFKLEQSLFKSIKYFSSGMLQRSKLLLALSTTSTILLLDEPHTNLDKNGIEVFNRLVNARKKDSLLIISSNREEEIELCDMQIELKSFVA